MERTYYIECKINGTQEKFRFDNKRSFEKYLKDIGQVLRCNNVTDLNFYSTKER